MLILVRPSAIAPRMHDKMKMPFTSIKKVDNPLIIIPMMGIKMRMEYCWAAFMFRTFAEMSTIKSVLMKLRMVTKTLCSNHQEASPKITT